MTKMKRKLLTPREVAELLSVTPRTVARWCREEKIPGARKVGRVWRIEDNPFYH